MAEIPSLARLTLSHVTGGTQELAHCVVHVPDMGMEKIATRVAQSRTQWVRELGSSSGDQVFLWGWEIMESFLSEGSKEGGRICASRAGLKAKE